MTDSPDDRPSTASLIGDAISQATSLVSTELHLVRLEATEKLIGALMAVVGIIFAAVFMMVALIFLLQGLVELLVAVTHWPAFGASFAVGGGIAVVAIIAIIVALRGLSAAKLSPTRTMRQVQHSTDAVKGAIS